MRNITIGLNCTRDFCGACQYLLDSERGQAREEDPVCDLFDLDLARNGDKTYRAAVCTSFEVQKGK